MDRPLVVLDTETAALGGAPWLIELGAVRVVDGEIEDHFESLVCPQVPIEPEATDVHGLTDDDVRAAPEAGRVLADFAAWVGDDWMAAHNAAFDARVLGFEMARHGIEPPPGPVIDSVKLARKQIPDAPDHKLATLTDFLGIEVDVHHRALADAVSCWKVIEACIERLGGGEGLGAAALVAASGSPVTVAGCSPTPPRRFPARLRPLTDARERGLEVTLHYGEPGKSPSRLPVVPRLLYESWRKGYLEAECARSGLLKTYRLDRVQRVEPLT